MTVFLQIYVCQGNGYLKEFPKNIVMFVRPIIEQTKVHFKILELLVITFGTIRYYNAMLIMSGVYQTLLENAFSRTRTHTSRCVSG